jgi:putative protease
MVETKEIVSNGDGLCFFDPEKGLVGIKVNRVEDGKIYPKDPVNLPAGVTIYRNSDTIFNKLLSRSEECRTIAAQLLLKETADGLQLLVKDEDEIESETIVEVEKTVARQAGMVAALAEKQLRKSGGSVFSIGEVSVDLRPDLFFPAAVFNDLRRKGLAHHLEQRLQQYQVERAELTVNDFPWPSGEVSYLDNISNRKAEEFYNRHGVARIDRKTLRATDVEDCTLMTTKYCIRAQLEICPKMSNKVDGFAGPLTIVDNTGEYELGFDCTKCEMTIGKLQNKE